MATIKQDLTAQYQTTKNGDMNDRQFKAGDEVTIVQKWSRYFLVKDTDGHYFNLAKEKVQE